MKLLNVDNKQTIYNLLAQIILQGTNFLLIMLFTRFMSTANYGVVSIYQAYATFFITIIGLSVQGTIGAAFAHLDKKSHNDYLASIYMVSCLCYLLINAIALMLKNALVEFTGLSWILILLMLAYSFGNFSFNFLSIKFVYMRKAEISCLLSLIIALGMIILSWLSITQDIYEMPEYMGRILSLSIPYILFALLALIMIFKDGNPFVMLKESLKFCLPMSIPLVLHSISSVFLGQTDKIMLQKILKDVGAVGIYSFIVTFVHLLNTIYVALNNTWTPIYYSYLKNNNMDELRIRSNRYFDFFTNICLGFILLSPEIVKIFADHRYWVGIKIIPISTFAIFLVFEYTFAVNFELYRRKTQWIALGTVIAALCNMILNIILIPRYSMFGAAIATCISYGILFIIHYIRALTIGNGEFTYNVSFFIANNIKMLIVSVIFWVALEYYIVRWGLAIIVGLLMAREFNKNKVFF